MARKTVARLEYLQHIPHGVGVVLKIEVRTPKKWGMLGTKLCQRTEADLGMYSMFGRTGAPQKGAPTKAQFFFHFCNMVTSQKY